MQVRKVRSPRGNKALGNPILDDSPAARMKGVIFLRRILSLYCYAAVSCFLATFFHRRDAENAEIRLVLLLFAMTMTYFGSEAFRADRE
jgi:hypothetical protein